MGLTNHQATGRTGIGAAGGPAGVGRGGAGNGGGVGEEAEGRGGRKAGGTQ